MEFFFYITMIYSVSADILERDCSSLVFDKVHAIHCVKETKKMVSSTTSANSTLSTCRFCNAVWLVLQKDLHSCLKKFFFCDQNPALYCIVGVAWGTGEEKGGSPYEYFNSSSLCVPEMVPLFSLEGLHNEFHRKNIKKSLKKCIVQGLCALLLPSCFCLFVQIQMELEISR